MPSKKKKYNARFPAGRIKKIMQTDEEVGKVAQAVPVIISRTLELFVESLLTKTLKITNARNAKTLSPSHMKQCIISESRFDFLRDLVKNIPDMGINEELSGSEAGYGNEGTSPASTSTSSSSASYSNGGAAAATASASASLIAGHHHHLPYEMVHPASLQRSESYTPATASISLLPQHHHNSQPSHGKRGLSQGASLNFYKEIPLEGTESPPPPKLNRLNSAPAGGAPTTPLPFKIDILPNLPAGSATTVSSPVSKPVSTYQPSSGAITPQITYNFERLAAAAPSAPSLEPVIKLDYSNLRLPATSASPHWSRSTGPVPVPSSSSSSSLQPTIKIDLSSLATGGTTALYSADGGGGGSRTPKKLTETGTGGAGGSKQYASPTTSTATLAANSAAVQSPVASALTAPPLFSALSSTIPGMDEDYDDI